MKLPHHNYSDINRFWLEYARISMKFELFQGKIYIFAAMLLATFAVTRSEPKIPPTYTAGQQQMAFLPGTYLGK